MKTYHSFFDFFPDLKNKKKPLIATHRGYGKKGPYPENCMIAFQKSDARGFYIHELDVRITRDNIPLVFHGKNLTRTTSGSGILENKFYKEIQNLDWGYYLKEEKTHKKQPPLTLSDYLNKFGKKSYTNIELKHDWYRLNYKLENSVLDICRPDFEKKIFFSSFNILAIRYMKNKAPQVPTGLLVEPGVFMSLRILAGILVARPDFIHLPLKGTSKNTIKILQKKKYPIIIWTVNKKEDYQLLKSLGVTLVITDNIEEFSNYL